MEVAQSSTRSGLPPRSYAPTTRTVAPATLSTWSIYAPSTPAAHLMEAITRLQRLRCALVRELGRNPTFLELAHELGVGVGRDAEEVDVAGGVFDFEQHVQPVEQ